MTDLADSRAESAKRRTGYALRPAASLTLACLLIALVGVALIALTLGAAGIPLARLPAALGLWADTSASPNLARDQLVLWSIRIPRIAAAAMVGGLLAAAGAIMQGLFRNPLADPALVGVSSGGALGSGGGDRFHRQPDRREPPLHAKSIAADRGLRRLAGDDYHPLSQSRAARDGRRLPSSCWRELRSPPSPMPASGFWCSSPTTASCATSRSGCWAR